MSRTPNIIRDVLTEEETTIKLFGEWDSPEADILSNAWFSALAVEHKLPDWIRYMEGMSGKKYRYLINNLIETMPDPRYLEIGSHAGSTACSALWGNKCKATCIDNWSEFGGPKDQFHSNIDRVLTPDIDFKFIESDFRNVDYSSIGKYNIYMFDGPHFEQDQYDGIDLVKDALDDKYILIVDDYNWDIIRRGTEQALEHVGHKVIAKIEVSTMLTSGHPVVSHQYSDWHDGYLIALVSKT
jgi:hypothetical protein